MSDEKFTRIAGSLISGLGELVDWGVDGGHTTEAQLRLTVQGRQERAKSLIDAGFSQRQTAKLLDVDEGTIRGDVRKNSALSAEKFRTHAHVSNNTGNNEWYTPARYIDLARSVMGGIDCDPASSDEANKTVKAATYYTAEQDGLKLPWHGRVWMNPPYSQPLIDEFAQALVAKLSTGEVSQATVLVNNATDTQWFHAIARHSSAICFPKGRIRFMAPDGKEGKSPLQGQAFIYIGGNHDSFRELFEREGIVLGTRGHKE